MHHTVTHRDASYYERVVETILRGDEHIDDWNVWCVKDVGFGFDEENHKPVKVVCTSNLEEFDCGISFRGMNVIDKSESQQQKYIDNQGEQQ